MPFLRLRRGYRNRQKSVIPTGGEPLDFARGRLREAQWWDLFRCLRAKK